MANPDSAERGACRSDVVYFARVGDYVKIGWSIDAAQRVRQLANDPVTVRPADLSRDDRPVLLGTISGDRDREADVHADLWEWQAVGEWFEATPFVLDYIDSLLGRVHA